MEQVTWYLSTGVLLTIIVSLSTPQQPKALLDKLLHHLRTLPVGQEDINSEHWVTKFGTDSLPVSF